MSPDGHPHSFLDLVDICDNVDIDWSSNSDPKFNSDCLVPWCLSPPPNSPAIGLLRPVVVDQLRKENAIAREKGSRDVWDIVEQSPSDATRLAKPRVHFSAWVDTPSKRTAVMKELCERWRDTCIFEDVCGPKKWRDEMYPVYCDPFGTHDRPKDEDRVASDTNYAFEMERSACALFGVVTYSIHMTIYKDVEETNSGKISTQIWVPTRAKTKPTWPGYLDNSVAGGIRSGSGVIESVVEESMEEASIGEDIVRKHAKPVGAVSYFFRTAKGWLQPEIEYVFDLCIPPETDASAFQPKPNDDEVESFDLLPLDDVILKMKAGLFKPNCALALIDFLIRHGHLTPDNEPDFMEIITRIHGRFDYERWQPDRRL